MAIINSSSGGVKPKILTTPDGVTDEIAIEKASSGKVKPSSTLGNATADKVLAGSTFTSDSGFTIAGTSTLATDYEQAQETLQSALFMGESNLGLLPVNASGWRDCAYGNGVYVVLRGSSAYVKGTDAGGWSTGSLPISASFIAFGNGNFLAASKNGTTACYSTNGTNWTTTTVPFNVQRIRFLNGSFFIIGTGNGQLAKSTDCVSWTNISVSGYTGYKFLDVCYGNGKYILSVNYADTVLYSDDTSTWNNGTINKQSSSRSYSFQNITFNNGTFITGITNQCYFSSTDGISWNFTILDYDSLIAVGYDNCNYVSSGNGVFIISTSTSNAYQVIVGSSPGDEAFISIDTHHYGIRTFFVNGKFIMLFESNTRNSGSSHNEIKYSYDGLYWMTSLSSIIEDVNGTDKTQETLATLKGISTETLAAAYAEGVNSVE